MKIQNKDKHEGNIKIDAIAEQWVNIVLAHVRAKRLSKKGPVRINRNYEYATK